MLNFGTRKRSHCWGRTRPQQPAQFSFNAVETATSTPENKTDLSAARMQYGSLVDRFWHRIFLFCFVFLLQLDVSLLQCWFGPSRCVPTAVSFLLLLLNCHLFRSSCSCVDLTICLKWQELTIQASLYGKGPMIQTQSLENLRNFCQSCSALWFRYVWAGTSRFVISRDYSKCFRSCLFYVRICLYVLFMVTLCPHRNAI